MSTTQIFESITTDVFFPEPRDLTSTFHFGAMVLPNFSEHFMPVDQKILQMLETKYPGMKIIRHSAVDETGVFIIGYDVMPT